MTIVLLLTACLGHVVLMIGCHNYFYGQRLPKRVGDLVHLAFGSLTLALPIYLLAAGQPTFEGLGEADGPYQQALLAYLAVCLVAGAGWLPYITLSRLLRKEPVEQARSEVVDLAWGRGTALRGDGHHGFLGKLPGNEIFHVEYSERTLRPVGLPAAWDGLTILHLSDLHFHGTPAREYFEAIADRCALWGPDLVCITGDIADSPSHHSWIAPVLGRLRWKAGAYAIMGNHDHRHGEEPVRRELRALGMTVLENEWVRGEVRGEPLVVIGDERPWLRKRPDLTGRPAGAFQLYLSHTPDYAGEARRAGASLMLAGHVHGGQIRVPPFGSLLVPSTVGRRYDAGTYRVGDMLLHVSRGLSGEHPVRYNCLPEVTLLTLRAGAVKAGEAHENGP